LHSSREADYTVSGHSKSRRENKNFGQDQNALLSEQFQGQKLTFWPAFFLKHKLHLTLPMTMQKSQRNVNFNGIKLALKNLGRFLSPTASRAVLRGQNALGKQKIQFLLQSSCNVNINTVWKQKNF
jgi:hypothetical protein